MGFMNVLKFSAACFDLILGRPLFAVGYPLCASIWIILTCSISDIGKLVTYWVLFSLISLFDDAFADFLKWIPFWPCIKLLVICWLVIPHFDGSYYVYQHLVHPCLSMDPQVASKLKSTKPDVEVKEIKTSAAAEKKGEQCEEPNVAQKEIQVVKVTEMKNGDGAKRCEGPNVAKKEIKVTEVTQGTFGGTAQWVKQTEVNLGETKSNTTCIAEIKERATALVTADIEACRDDRTCEIPLHKKVQKEYASAVCQVTTQSEATLNSHLQGKIHQATSEQLKAKSQATKTNGSPSASMSKKSDQSTNEEQLKCTSNNLNSKNNGISAASTVMKPDETKDDEQGHQKNLKQTGDGMKELGLWCNICNVSCTSELDMASHLNGRRHFNMIKQPSELWCSNCNVKCNSEADMAIHRNGRRHWKQLKARSGLWCSICSVSCNSKVTMDSHINGRRHLKQSKETVKIKGWHMCNAICNSEVSMASHLNAWCNICNVSCTSDLEMASHLKGRRHFKRIKQLSELWCSNCNVKCNSEADMASHRNGSRHLEQLNERSGLCCSICSVSCNSQVDMDSHLNGRRHLNQIEEQLRLWCGVCNVICSSEVSMAFHLNGRRHLKKKRNI